jgi:hypothetical protein
MAQETKPDLPIGDDRPPARGVAMPSLIEPGIASPTTVNSCSSLCASASPTYARLAATIAKHSGTRGISRRPRR